MSSKSQIYALDLETACNVAGCPEHGSSLCSNKHSLSPWHAKITIIGIVQVDGPFRAVYKTVDELNAALKTEPLAAASFIGHNFKFDALFGLVHGINITLDRWIGCTQLMAYVSTNKIPDAWIISYDAKRKGLGAKHRKGSKHSLKTLAPYKLGVEPFWEPPNGHHDDPEYVLKDAEYTARLYTALKAELKSQLGAWEFYEHKQLAWAKMAIAAELRGLRLDNDDMFQMELDLKAKAFKLKEQLDIQWRDAHIAYRSLLKSLIEHKYEEIAAKYSLSLLTSPKHLKLYQIALSKLPAEVEVDFQSPQQMAWLLRDHLGYDIQGFDGKESTDAKVLQRLASEGKQDVALFLNWRKTNKLLTSFLPRYKELSDVKGDLHPIYNLAETRTGRSSSERPNAQQVPPSLRALFKARPGYKIVGYDMAAIEAKIIAYYSEDPVLYGIIKEGVSIHDHNTRVFLDIEAPIGDIATLHTAERAATKNVGFALFYNAGANRIRMAYAQKGYHLTQAQCKQILNKFRKEYAASYDFASQVVNQFENGDTIHNLFGRPLIIENPEDAYMKGFNKLVQSSASDMLLDSTYSAWQEAKQKDIDAHPLLFVHDYAGFEVKDEQAEEFSYILRSAMTNYKLNTKHGQILLAVDGGISTQWDSGYLDEEIEETDAAV